MGTVWGAIGNLGAQAGAARLKAQEMHVQDLFDQLGLSQGKQRLAEEQERLRRLKLKPATLEEEYKQQVEAFKSVMKREPTEQEKQMLLLGVQQGTAAHTEFGLWMAQNPGKPVEDWLKLKQETRPTRTSVQALTDPQTGRPHKYLVDMNSGQLLHDLGEVTPADQVVPSIDPFTGRQTYMVVPRTFAGAAAPPQQPRQAPGAAPPQQLRQAPSPTTKPSGTPARAPAAAPVRPTTTGETQYPPTTLRMTPEQLRIADIMIDDLSSGKTKLAQVNQRIRGVLEARARERRVPITEGQLASTNALTGLRVLEKSLFGDPTAQEQLERPGLQDTIGVLDSTTSRSKLSFIMGDPSKEGRIGRQLDVWTSKMLSQDEKNYLYQYNNAVSAINALRQVTGLPRSTQQLFERYMRELPNPMITPSSADARRQIAIIKRDINAARSILSKEGFDKQGNGGASGGLHFDNKGNLVKD